jgi:hypothetical protein
MNRGANVSLVNSRPDGPIEPYLVEDARYMERISAAKFGSSFQGYPINIDQCHGSHTENVTHAHSALTSFREGRLIS